MVYVSGQRRELVEAWLRAKERGREQAAANDDYANAIEATHHAGRSGDAAERSAVAADRAAVSAETQARTAQWALGVAIVSTLVASAALVSSIVALKR